MYKNLTAEYFKSIFDAIFFRMYFTSEELIAMKNLIFSSSSYSTEEEEEPIAKRRKRFWVRPYYKGRNESGAHIQIFGALNKLNDQQLFHNYMRMSSPKFEELLLLVGPSIEKKTIIREPLSNSMRLAITLVNHFYFNDIQYNIINCRYLATGESQRSLSLDYECSPSSTHNIIIETTDAITSILKSKVFPILNKERFKEIGAGFDLKWNFPNCMGAIDGKHVTIEV